MARWMRADDLGGGDLALAQAGEDFANGADLQGVIQVAEAAAGGLKGFGSIAVSSADAALVADGHLAADISGYLSDAINFTNGVDGVVGAIGSGNIAAGFSSGFSALAALGGAMEEMGSTVINGATTITNKDLYSLGSDRWWVSLKSDLAFCTGRAL